MSIYTWYMYISVLPLLSSNKTLRYFRVFPKFSRTRRWNSNYLTLNSHAVIIQRSLIRSIDVRILWKIIRQIAMLNKHKLSSLCHNIKIIVLFNCVKESALKSSVLPVTDERKDWMEILHSLVTFLQQQFKVMWTETWIRMENKEFSMLSAFGGRENHFQRTANYWSACPIRWISLLKIFEL